MVTRKQGNIVRGIILATLCCVIGISGANPVLIPGTWQGIGPQQSSNSEVWYVRVDPNNPNVIYACCSRDGLVKTTDGGSTWKPLPTGNCVTGLEIDPANSQHLYISYAFTAGGFWESMDGGENWTQHATPVSSDIGLFRVDPSDFDHVLVSFHYCPVDTIAFIETTDGGATWKIHHISGVGGGGTKGVHFLSCPKLGIGNGKTWLVSPEGGQMYRTSDGGANWTAVAQGFGGPHGGEKTTYYTAKGVLYIAAVPTPIRTSDNGITWQKLNLGNAMYESIMGDGNTLYTSNPEGGTSPVYTSPESDGMTWTTGTQIFGRGATDLAYDPVLHIMYSANRAYGVYALNVNDPNTGIFLSNSFATPSSVFDSATTTVTLSVDATAQGSISGITINLTPIGGNASVAMTKTTGNSYSTVFTILPGVTPGDKGLLVTATDNNSHTLYGSITLGVLFHSAPVLVSRNKTVTVSSTQEAAYPGSAAVDGNAGTRWSSGAGDPQWIYVDLGSVIPVNQVILKWESAYASGYKIQVSTDASTWTDVYTTTTGNGGTDSIIIAPTDARYVRMYGTVRGTNYAYSLYEFEIYSPAGGATVSLPGRINTQTALPGLSVSPDGIRVSVSKTTIPWTLSLYSLNGAKTVTISGIGNEKVALAKSMKAKGFMVTRLMAGNDQIVERVIYR